MCLGDVICISVSFYIYVKNNTGFMSDLLGRSIVSSMWVSAVLEREYFDILAYDFLIFV